MTKALVTLRAAAALVAFAFAPSASACPVCATAGGAVVRAGIFNSDFITTLGEMGLTMVGLGVAIFFMDGWLPE